MFHSNRGTVVTASLALLCAVIAFSAGFTSVTPAADGERSPSLPVDLNSAGPEQLTSIPGIGEAMAKRIVEWRKEHGPFHRVEDLMKIKGIGEKSLEKMRPHVTVKQHD